MKVGGEIGRRIDNTIYKNIMVIDVDRDFLAPLKTKQEQSTTSASENSLMPTVKLAAYSGDEKVLARKKHLVDVADWLRKRPTVISAISRRRRE